MANPKKRAAKKDAKKAKRPAPAAKKPAKSPAKKAPPRRPAKAPVDEPAEAAEAKGEVFGVEVDADSVDATLAKVREELGHFVKKGRYTKVRFKFRGKPILPDLPIAAVVAAEALSFYWAGILRAVLFTLGAGSLLEVELVNDSEREVAKGKEALLAGELEKAVECFERAASMNRDSASAHLNLGIAHRLKGDKAAAIAALEKAAALGKETPLGTEAERILGQLRPAEPPQAANGG